jgi:PAS domain S-box-containing protein
VQAPQKESSRHDDHAKTRAPVADTDLYRALFAAAQDGLLVVDDQGRYVEVNDAYARLLKTTRAALIGHHFSEFMPPGRLREAEEAFGALVAKGQGLSEFPLRAVDGTLVDCEWTVQGHFLPGLSLCSARDIRRRKDAEEGLRASEAQFRFLTNLDDATRPLTDPEEIVRTAARLLAEHLDADSVAYCHFDPDQERFHVTGEFRRPGVPSMLGDYTLAQFGAVGDFLRTNRPFVVEDMEGDPPPNAAVDAYRQLKIRAHLAVPLHKTGHLLAALGIQQLEPRKWRPQEIELLQLVANRCWESIERARMEARLRRQTHSFDTLLSNLPDLICTFDLGGRFTYANPALLGVWRQSLDDIIGKNTFDLGYPLPLAARIQSEVQRVIQTGHPVRNHTPFAGPDSETRVYEYIFSPVLGADKVLEGVTCTARDITERERMEKEVTESRQRLQQLLSQAPVAIIVFRGQDLVIELANPFYEDLVPGRQLEGRPLAQAIPELGADVFGALHQVLETGEAFTASDWAVPYDKDRDGIVEDHWFNVVYHPLREADGAVSRVVAVCSDVTPQVVARKELERANRELEEFAYVASHDLQEPLRMVAIYSEMLLSRYVANDPKAREYAAFVHQGVERMEQLIHDLLAYSRIVHTESDKSGSADLNESLAEALRTLDSRIVETQAIVAAAPLPLVRGEASQFTHVFQNLLSNSLKYRRPHLPPEIRISAAQEGDRWVISVADNGIGFEPQYAQRIFGLFKRLHKDEFSGTGLGLAICQRIVERYGGRIWAQGHPGEGATFHIALMPPEAERVES